MNNGRLAFFNLVKQMRQAQKDFYSTKAADRTTDTATLSLLREVVVLFLSVVVEPGIVAIFVFSKLRVPAFIESFSNDKAPLG